MDRSELKKIFTSIYIIFIMISLGFLCVITINDIMDNGGVSGSSIIVAKSSNGDYNSIQIAINNANSGDTIYVWSGTYIENIVVNKKVNLIGNSSTNTTIDGGANGRVLKIVTDGVMVSGFSIINSGMSPSSPYDSGITLDHVKNVIIINNSCSNNFFGIHLIFYEYNQIINNTCNLNYFMGIFTFS